jgi:hypothetical protein
MARIINEAAYHSKKISNVQPPEWRAEFAWLLPLSTVDGTFEADPRDVWSKAYAYARPDWTPDKITQLLDEFERVGLLRRTQDPDGRVWGFWVGSDNFQPKPSHLSRYKVGKRSLFGAVPTTSPSTPDDVPNASPSTPENIPTGLGVGLGVGVGFEKEKEQESDLDSAPMSSENENSNEEHSNSNPKSVSAEVLSPTPTPTPKTRLRKVVPRAEYEAKKEEKDFAAERQSSAAVVAEFAAELASRPPLVWTPEDIERLKKPRSRAQSAGEKVITLPCQLERQQ